MAQPTADGIVRGTLGAGLLFGFILSLRLRGNVELQKSMTNVSGMFLLSMLCVIIISAAILYGQTSREHAAYCWAAWVAGGVSALGFIPAHHYGWLSGAAFAPPLWLQLLVYGLALVAYCFFGLQCLRVFERRRGRAWGLAAYGVFVVLWAGVGAVSTQRLQDSGDYLMRHGYNEAWDTAWSFAMYVVAFVLFETLRRRRSTTPSD